MCLAAPSLVIEVRDGTAITKCFGQTREVSLLLLVPGSADNWVSTDQNKRRFIKFPVGDFGFLKQ